MSIQTINPANGTSLESYKLLSKTEIKSKIGKAHQTFLSWKKLTLVERQKFFLKLIDVLEQEKDNCARLSALEMGKPIQFGRAEIEKCIWCCRFYIEQAPNFLESIHVQTEFASSYVTYNPLGVILAVMPWNFPFWQVLRFAIPTLMAGNTVLLKHASIVAGSGQKIEELFVKAGFPEHALSNLCINSSEVADIIADSKVQGVTLTGSEEVGRKIASTAGLYLKKVSLELGGNDACLVLADANLKEAAKAIVSSRMRNTGQVCVATKRVIVDSQVHDELVELIRLEMKKFTMGNPLDDACNFGPMAREDLRQELHQQVQTIIKEGGVLVEGGFIHDGEGFYYPPTLITHVTKESLAYEQELFGPVIAISQFSHLDEGLELVNFTDYGLGGAVFSTNIEIAQHLATHIIESGVCFVNLPVTSDPRLPFGGIKNSGFGRELSKEGMIEFMNIKTVIIND